MQALRAASLFKFICVSVLLSLEDLVYLVSSIPSVSYTPLPPLPQGSLGTEGRDLMEASHLGQSVERSFTLNTLSICGSLSLFPFVAGKNFSDDA